MTVRVRRGRRGGMAALALLAGASLLRSSMAVSAPRSNPAHTLNLRLENGKADPAPDAAIGKWVSEGLPAKNWKLAEAALTVPPRGIRDGLSLLALVVKVGGDRPRPVLTNAVTSEQLVSALGVELGKDDRVKPTGMLWTGMRFQVVRIEHVVETTPVTVPFETLIQYSKAMDPSEVRVTAKGQMGTAVWTWRVTYRNGREIGRVLLSENVLTPPVDEVLLKGKPASGAHGSQIGQASWYDFCRIDGDYAAHLTLPFGTVVTVTNLDNGKTVIVVINDRGPYGVPGRIIDLCDSAFSQIAPLSQGVANVQIAW
jgi:surface rod structure-forming protein G/rare lipoprotein A (RlpA)-like double-psi beta-barrel protein